MYVRLLRGSGFTPQAFIGACIHLGADPRCVLNAMTDGVPGRVRAYAMISDEPPPFRLEGSVSGHVSFHFSYRPPAKHSPADLVEKSLRVCLEGRRSGHFLLRALSILVQAERRLHHMDEVHLHETQSVVPLFAGVAACLDELDVQGIVLSGPVTAGSGVIEFSHGRFQVPTPATRYICRIFGIELETGPSGEWITPSGAALLASLVRGVRGGEREHMMIQTRNASVGVAPRRGMTAIMQI